MERPDAGEVLLEEVADEGRLARAVLAHQQDLVVGGGQSLLCLLPSFLVYGVRMSVSGPVKDSPCLFVCCWGSFLGWWV